MPLVPYVAPAGSMRIRKGRTEALRADAERIINELAPEIAQVFLDAVAQVSDSIVLTRVRDALEAGDVSAAVKAIPWESIGAPYMADNLPPILRRGLEESGAVAAENVTALYGLDAGLVYDVTRDQAVRWLRSQSAELVTNISTETMKTLRVMMSEAVADNVTPAELSYMLRDSNLFGLTARDAQALLRFRARQIEGEDGLPKDRVNVLVERKAQQYLDNRATTIGRTEAADAFETGKAELWEQARARGIIDRRAMVELVVFDPCDLCSTYDGEKVPVGAPFHGGKRPPFHPRCECQAVLRPFGSD